MAAALENLAAGTLLKLRQIVSYQGGKDCNGDVRAPYIGLLPLGRSKWLKLCKEGKVPPGRKMNPGVETSTVVWTKEEIQQVLEGIKNGELQI